MEASFLSELADSLFKEYGEKLEEVSIIFPNRRAGLFFTRALSIRIDKPVWSPSIFSFEDFVYSISHLKEGDNLSLLLELYEVFKLKSDFKESFDKFYFWGDMLLKDFNEIDSNLVDAKDLYVSLKNLKEIDVQFNYMSEDQKLAMKSFWSHALNHPSGQKKAFLQFWQSLYPIYTNFKKNLSESNTGYQGMIYRELLKGIQEQNFSWKGGRVIFVGFNALSASEEAIVKWFSDKGLGRIIWDLDQYYFNNPKHEAGMFFRKYYHDPELKKSFPSGIPENFKNVKKNFYSIASGQYSGQAKIAGNIIVGIKEDLGPTGIDNTVVVISDETLLSQVLYALPEGIEKFNVTMGYPISSSSFYSLIDNILDLQNKVRISKKGAWYYYKNVLNILNHHLVAGNSRDEIRSIIDTIEKKNLIYVPADQLLESDLLRIVFKPLAGKDLFNYLIEVLLTVRDNFLLDKEGAYFFEKEFAIVFYKLLTRLKDVFKNKNIEVTPQILKRILKYYSRFEKIPFTGEPLHGLQLMGLIETRNLDFENIIIVGSNEGLLPGTGIQNSFIPHNVRKAFGLPNPDTNGAIFSYLFYRLIQRAKNIYLIYNTEESSSRNAEPSRYIHQLTFESGYEIKPYWLSTDISVSRIPPIVVNKNGSIIKRLNRYLVNGHDKQRRITPSALNRYLLCPLSFYYRYVLDIREKTDISEDLDAAKFGNILHEVMEVLYQPYIGKNVSGQDIIEIRKTIESALEKGFSSYYGQDKTRNFQFEGKNILGKEIVRKYVRKILNRDLQLGTFKIIALEQNLDLDIPIEINGNQVMLAVKGIIDRIDIVNGTVRIVDYKTGKDESHFKSIQSLFDTSDDKRNKAVFQTFIYSILYLNNYSDSNPVQACLYNSRELYQKDFDPRVKIGEGRKKLPVDDIRPLIKEFQLYFEELIQEIFDPEIPFKHHELQDSCFYCENMGMPSDLDI